MEISELIDVAPVVLALLALAHQQYLTRQQSKAETITRHFERTQSLLFKALDNPDLLEAISGTSEDEQRQRRFRQLWFNHIEMIFRQKKLFEKSHWQATLSDIQEFLTMQSMITHWEKHQHGYSMDFRSFINEDVMITKKAEPQNIETPLE